MLAVVCLVTSIRTRIAAGRRRKLLILFFLLLTLSVAFDLAAILNTNYIIDGNPFASQTFLFLYSLFFSMLPPMILIFILHFTGEDVQESRIQYVVMIIWVTYVVLLVTTQFTTFIYYYTDDNVYHRGPYYSLLLIPPAVIMILTFVALLQRRSRLSQRQFKSFLIYILTPLACILMQMRFYGIHIIVLGTCVASFIMFYNIFGDQMAGVIRQREENLKLLADNRILQMRPHFIYNTLMSIYYLCGTDPAKAQQVILDFSSYLRKNFTAIGEENTIPFSEELEHTRAYLAVETVRFEDSLSVEFDTPHVNFRVPPLTLQPLVENSVKHGLDPDSSPLHILVRSYDTNDCNVIMVEDNGTGFDSSTAPEASEIRGPEGSEPHVALDNIRARLGMLCRGTLEIAPRKEGGTSVTIRIPH